ncbi:MAG: hypothetical protein ACRDTR_13310, partial [Rubrobacter sp.]
EERGPGLRIPESPPRYQGAGPHGEIRFRLHNDGSTAASNVHVWIQFASERLKPIDPDDLVFDAPIMAAGHLEDHGMEVDDAPEDGVYTVRLSEKEKSPGAYRTFRIPVVFVSPGPSRISYAAVCNEGASTEGHLDVIAPSVQEHGRRMNVGHSGLSAEALGDLKERVWGIICKEWEDREDEEDGLGILESVTVYERLRREGVEVPDYAMIEVLDLLREDRIEAIGKGRRSEEEIRSHGGMLITEADMSLCEGP